MGDNVTQIRRHSGTDLSLFYRGSLRYALDCCSLSPLWRVMLCVVGQHVRRARYHLRHPWPHLSETVGPPAPESLHAHAITRHPTPSCVSAAPCLVSGVRMWTWA